MQRYDSYKDSGVKWLGEIPSHWEVCKVKNLCVEIFSGGTPSSGETKYWDGNIPWIPSGMCHDCDIECAPKYITELGYRNSSTRFIPSGTTVMAMTGATCSMVGFLNFESCANQSVTAFVSHKRLLKSRYLFFLLQAMRKYILTFQTGGAQGGINVNDCKNLIIPRIPAEEQEAIANYLDAATSQIDEAISQQQKMIDLLNERKQIIINNAVTKGLDPNVKMKPSGIDWIGDIPEHWEVLKLKYLGTIKSGDGIKNEDLHETGEYPVWGGNGLMGYTNLYNKDNNAIIIGRVGALCGNVRYLTKPTFVTDNALIYSIKGKIDHLFLLYTMKAANLNSLNTSNAQPLITGSKVKNVAIPFPRQDEQKSIVSFLTITIDNIDKIVNKYREQISLLQERKQIIINDVVTGKVKVV